MAYRASGTSKATLFLGDLSSVCSEEDIEKVFIPYGKIRHIRIQRSPSSCSSLGYGFIRMGNPAEAMRAKEDLDGFLLCGRKIRVRDAAFGVGGDTAAKPPPKNSLFVRFTALSRNAFTDEEKIRAIYSQLGPISDVSIRESRLDKKTGIQKGYGFVHFDSSGPGGSEGVEAALGAVTNVPQVVIDQVLYVCEVSRNLQAQLAGPASAQTQTPAHFQAPANSNTPGSYASFAYNPNSAGSVGSYGGHTTSASNSGASSYVNLITGHNHLVGSRGPTHGHTGSYDEENSLVGFFFCV